MAARWRMRWRVVSQSSELLSAPLLRAALLGPSRLGQLLKQPAQPAIAFIPPRVHRARGDRGHHRASRLAHVPAIRKAALWCETRDLDESKVAAIEPVDRRSEVTDTGRVDQAAASRQIEQVRGCGCVSAFLLAHEIADFDGCLRHEPPDQGRLAHAGL